MTRARDSAAYRIAFTYAAAFALATLILGTVVYIAAHAAFVRQLDGRIADASAEFVSAYRSEGMGELREGIALREARGSSDELGYALFDARGNCIAGALLLGGYLRKRLGDITATADAIISGDMDQRMAVGTRIDEFDRLSLTLNNMLDRIAALLGNLRQVSSDVAHDLRTPLARLRHKLERALSEAGDPPTQRRTIKEAIDQTDDVLGLFAAILRISEIEGGSVRQAFTRIDLSALASDLAESYAPAVEDRGRTLRSDIAPDIAIHGDRELVAQAIINLLDNAQFHTPKATLIDLPLHSEDGRVRLTVRDNGPGVPADDRDRIAARFTRLEDSRTTSGHGLGLNLVSAIALLHDGKLEFSDNHPGLAASVILPEAIRNN